MRRALLFAAGGVLVGIAIHIVVIFLVPGFANRDAWTAMGSFGGDGTFHVLPRSQPGTEPLPFLDPLMIHAVCRFRLSEGPVHIVAPLPDEFWSVGIFDRRGRNVYSLNDRTAARNPLDLLLVTPADLLQLRNDPPQALETSIIVDLNVDTGFVLLRAFVADTTLIPSVEAMLAKADCAAPLVAPPAEPAADAEGEDADPTTEEPAAEEGGGLVEAEPDGALTPLR